MYKKQKETKNFRSPLIPITKAPSPCFSNFFVQPHYPRIFHQLAFF